MSATSKHSSIIQGTANAVYKFKTSEDTKVRPYLIGGVGLYNSKVTGDDVPDDVESSTPTSASTAARASTSRRARVGLFVEGRFHNVFTEGDNTKFIPITVGVRLGGS